MSNGDIDLAGVPLSDLLAALDAARIACDVARVERRHAMQQAMEQIVSALHNVQQIAADADAADAEFLNRLEEADALARQLADDSAQQVQRLRSERDAAVASRTADDDAASGEPIPLSVPETGASNPEARSAATAALLAALGSANRKARGATIVPTTPAAPTPPAAASAPASAPAATARATVEAADSSLRPKSAVSDDLPLTAGIANLVRDMEQLVAQVRKLSGAHVLPNSRKPIDADFLNEANALIDQLHLDFDAMHTECLTGARRRAQNLQRQGRPITNPMTFWEPESLRQYHEFRTRRFIEKFLDPLELRVNQLKDSDYRALLDELTDAMQIVRMKIESGHTTFMASLHESVDLQGQNSDGAAPVVNRVLLSGYHDKSDNSVLRKAFVQLRMRDIREGNNSAQRLALRHTESTLEKVTSTGATSIIANRTSIMGKTSHDDLSAKSVTVSDLGEVTVPEVVQLVKAQVFRLNSSIMRILNTDLPAAMNGPVNLEARAAVMESVARFYRGFQQFHERSKALAFLTFKRLKAENPALHSPSSGWEEQILYDYRAYRTTRLFTDCFDLIEGKIMQLGLLDHLVVLDLMAIELEIGRLPIVPGETPFNPERHQIDARLTQGTHSLRNKPIARLLQSGYYDLRRTNNEALIRKALVRVNL